MREIFKIDTDIPVPEKTPYRWADMRVGNSVKFPDNIAYHKALNACHCWRLRGGKKYNMKFKSSKPQLRIWRVQ